MTFDDENEIVNKIGNLFWFQTLVEELIRQRITSTLSSSNELFEGDYIDRIKLINSFNPGKICIVYYHNTKYMQSFAHTVYKQEFSFSELINFIS
jgi:hypothetical protein